MMRITFIKSIRFRLPAFFLLAALLPTLLSAIWSSGLLEHRMEEMFAQQAQDSAQVASNIFEEYAQDLFLKTRVISQSQSVSQAVNSNNYLTLINHLSDLYQDLNLQLYDAVIEIYAPNGQLMVAEPRQSKQLVPADHIQAALKGEFKNSRFFAGDELLICSSLPLYHASKPRPIAAMGISFRVSHQLVDQIRKISGTEVMVVQAGAEGHVLATTLDESSSQGLLKMLMADKRKNHVSRSLPYMLSSVSHSVRNGEYLLVVALSVAQMHQMMASIKEVLVIVEFAAIVLALIIALGLSRNFISKLMELVRLSQKVEAGDLDTQVQLESQDEFGVLAQTLDSMRLEIRQTLREKELMISNLTIRDEINQAIISRSGNELLLQVLTIVIEAIQAQQGSIMLVDRDSGQLLLKVVYDPRRDLHPVNVHERISFSIGEGIAGYVAQTGEAILCNDPHQDPRFKPYHFQEMDQRLANLLCLPLQVEETILGVISLDNKAGGFQAEDLIQLQDIAKQVAIAIKNAELYELSITDGLTGLYIRRYFQDMLEQELKRSLRFQMQTALILFDIDYFKRFNDTYGHQAGDAVLRRVASLVGHSIRDGVDTAARYGGEEFAIIMPDTDLQGAWQVAERLRQSIEAAHFEYEGQSLKVTISLGCAEFPLQADSRESLIEKADIALYASKHGGRNRSTCYVPELEHQVEISLPPS
ncbi:hypothetical protein COW36_13525 [bacterium (Candidatus Blackallbacteria) CG17_big_fil_post_rev_8_21_14_2_50_48_46]|uniref:Diguanylate cyclase n=1 Tax=bacterium (Candidatus Blackallbacteria) CG17_big_fil_post_rev_8_21_14_2_50_48_46 TaxID=2014261 RepID=A0A2M7G3D9_9BACT|nr:MAG: hypothetical protein COW64_22145 [bacterium (Candidatus Blackallbacteria) CG18_big_fil_WC_8_21_14_2_50_49_26]PIW16345.1 MAG: hypothetical protein COW36_13525 [bacterium (Candidatus Blackallbacteria) CG17_big_fil_post_rev_8_21_14_2_50_48_46]PIW45359.1 MAG: hypothetical protein COW20_20760 [bacterium (Candidatus Blackallbacteria) CG13_big_fil_rev_8_21_14_2_50_49_14]